MSPEQQMLYLSRCIDDLVSSAKLLEVIDGERAALNNEAEGMIRDGTENSERWRECVRIDEELVEEFKRQTRTCLKMAEEIDFTSKEIFGDDDEEGAVPTAPGSQARSG